MAMDSAATLLFNIKANPDDATENIARFRSLFSSNLGQLGTQIEEWSAEVFGEFESVKAAMLGLAAAGAAVLLAVGGALFEMANKTAEAGEEFELLHQQTGLSVETLSGLKVVAGETGVQFDTLVRGVEIMDRGLSPFASSGATAAKAMKALGVSATDAQGHLRPNTDLLADLADKFSHMKDGADKTAVAMSIFGRSGADMIPILDKGGDAIRHASERAQGMGQIFTELSAHQATEFLEHFRDIKYTVEGLGISIGQKLVPMITAGMSRVADVLAGSAGEISEFMSGVGTLLGWLGNGVLILMDTFETLGKAAALALAEISYGASAAWDALHGHFERVKNDWGLMKTAAAVSAADIAQQFSNLKAGSGGAADAFKALGQALSMQINPATAAATQQTDKLAQSLAQVKDALDSLKDQASKPEAAIEAQYQRAVASADAALAADKRLAAAHKITLADLSQRENEYNHLVADLGQQRDLKLQQLENDRVSKVEQLDRDLQDKLANNQKNSWGAKMAAINKEVAAERAKYVALDALDAAHEQMLAELRGQLMTAAFQAQAQTDAAEAQKFQSKYQQLTQLADQYYAASLKGADKIKFEELQEEKRIQALNDELMKLATTDAQRAQVAKMTYAAIHDARAKEQTDIEALTQKQTKLANTWAQTYAQMKSALSSFHNAFGQMSSSFLQAVDTHISALQTQAGTSQVTSKMAGEAIVSSLKETAIVQAIVATAKSIEAFAGLDFQAGAMYAAAAATYGMAAGEQIASLFGGGGGGGTGSKTSKASAALSSSTASTAAASRSSSSSGSNQTVVNIHINGGFISPENISSLMQQLNSASSNGSQSLVATHLVQSGAVVPA